MADVLSGSAGLLRVTASVVSNAAGNYSDVSWVMSWHERVSAGSTFQNSPVSANVFVGGIGTVWSGSFTFDWRPGGLQSQVIASGTTRVFHNPDGTVGDGVGNVQGSIGATGTSGGGGPVSAIEFVTLPVLRVAPNAPTAVAATRLSDSEASVSWSQSSPSNGQPTTNTIRRSVNNGAPVEVVSIGASGSATLACAANQKIVYAVRASNSAGASSWSADSAPIFTTPAAPSGVSASKVSGGNILVAWTPNVGFSEHEHVILHGVVVGSVITWDASPLGVVAAGVSTFTHTAPSPSQQHVYAVRARNTDAAALQSAQVQSNTVVLLTAPGKPTLPALPAFADRSSNFVLTWAHNAIDTTAQTAFEVGFSTNGGSSWTSTGKVTSAVASRTIAANTYAANQAVTMRVRTWGQATTGGSDGTGASPWSDLATVTFKSRPVASIVGPANGSVYAQAALAVQLGFSQAEAGTFVSATIELLQGATLLETVVSTTLASTPLATRVLNGGTYTVRAVVRDSHGLQSAQASATFTVAYTLPVTADAEVVFLRDSGIAQIDIDIAAPGAGEAAAVSVKVTRQIGDEVETVIEGHPASSSVTILDMVPTIYGTNLYRVITVSGDGAESATEVELETAEEEWAYMSAGPGFASVIRFGGELKPQASPMVDSRLVKTAGRARPLGMYSQTGSLSVSGTGEIVTGIGSTALEIEEFLLIPGRGCYRDPSGRRMFGRITGKVSRDSFSIGTFTYTVEETA